MTRAEEIQRLRYEIEAIYEEELPARVTPTAELLVMATLKQAEATLMVVDALDDFLNAWERGR